MNEAGAASLDSTPIGGTKVGTRANLTHLQAVDLWRPYDL